MSETVVDEESLLADNYSSHKKKKSKKNRESLEQASLGIVGAFF